MQLGVVVIEMCRGRGAGGWGHVGISILLVLVPLGYLPCFIVISRGMDVIAHIASINRHVRHRKLSRLHESQSSKLPAGTAPWPADDPLMLATAKAMAG
jgi:hypothetical protein